LFSQMVSVAIPAPRQPQQLGTRKQSEVTKKRKTERKTGKAELAFPVSKASN